MSVIIERAIPERAPDEAGAGAAEAGGRQWWLWGLVPPVFFAVLVLATYGGVLFHGDRVISAPSTDVHYQFLAWRQFGFGELRHGHLALWNPFIYGGTPYLAGFQSALLYPPNWLYLVMPLAPAINWGIALHIWLAGYFVYLWCRHRQAEPAKRVGMAPAMLGGVSFMFCGPYILHAYAGHLPHLCVMVWPALLLLALERMAQGGRWSWTLLGSVAAAMMVLAGHPQYVYYTGIIFAIYVLLLALRTRFWGRLVVGAAVMAMGAGALSAVQLLPGLDAASESLRAGGASYEFASTFGLPPENLPTLVAPNFLGALDTVEDPRHPIANEYSGRGYLWELSLFFGIVALVMAGVGIAAAPRTVTPVCVIILVALILALGKNIKPVYDALYSWFPGYASFRGTAKFGYLVVLFLTMLASLGLDALRLGRVRGARVAMAAGGLAALLLVAAWWADGSAGNASGAWGQLLHFVGDTGESYAIGPRGNGAWAVPGPLVSAIAQGAAMSFLFSAVVAVLVCIGALLAGSRSRRIVCVALLLVAAVEMGLFAHANLATSSPVVRLPSFWADPLEARPADRADERILLTFTPWSNAAMLMNFEAVWGYDPNVLRRYGQFVWAALVSSDVENATQNLILRPSHTPHWNMMRMIRLGMILQPPESGMPAAVSVSGAMARAQIIGYATTVASDSVLHLLESEALDERKTVVLEEVPAIMPAGSADPGTVTRCVRLSTDELEIEADVAQPAILLVTDNYASGWRVRPLEAGPQSEYQVLPGNYTQIAIPVAAGHHHLMLQYLPWSFQVGRAVSGVAVAALLAMCGLALRGQRRRAGARAAA